MDHAREAERKRLHDLSVVADAGLTWKARAESTEARLASQEATIAGMERERDKEPTKEWYQKRVRWYQDKVDAQEATIRQVAQEMRAELTLSAHRSLRQSAAITKWADTLQALTGETT